MRTRVNVNVITYISWLVKIKENETTFRCSPATLISSRSIQWPCLYKLVNITNISYYTECSKKSLLDRPKLMLNWAPRSCRTRKVDRFDPQSWLPCSSYDAWGTVLQVGSSGFRFPMLSLEFFIDIIVPAALWPLGCLSLQQKWVPGIIPGGVKTASK
jgi:hypothetical protein